MTAIGRIAAGACAFGVSLGSMPAAAKAAEAGTFQVSAHVPMACWVSQMTVDALDQDQGRVTEGCNSASGYIVSASHRPLKSAEHARLVYGERAFNLSAAGHQVVRREYGPRIQQVAYRFADVKLASPLTLSLTIQPI